MKFVNILTIAIIAFFLTITLVKASHIAETSINPSDWTANTDADVSLAVNNKDGDNIVKFELLIPETSDQKPIYLIKDITTPAGWTYKTTKRTEQAYPYKITWFTEGTGVEKGKSIGLGFTAQSPNSGSYNWAWITSDSKSGTSTGTLKTSIILAPVSYFTIEGDPTSIKAGETFKITVKVYDKDNKIKTDYTGKVKFTSTDYRAILPSDYTFKSTDKGLREFNIVYKTVGNQTFTVSDDGLKISKTSKTTTVNAGDAVSITISPDNTKISAGEKIEFTTKAKDKFGNKFDVTDKTTWNIDNQAGGTWSKNVYTSANKGVWTVTGTYRSLIDGVTLNIDVAPVKPIAPVEPVTPTQPTTPTEPLTPTQPVAPVTPLTPLVVIGEDSITIAPNSNDTMTLSVSNMGASDLTGVSLSYEGIPSDWILVYPTAVDIPSETSKDFIVLIAVPENETESKTITFKVTAQGGITASKDVALNIGTAPTGIFIGLSKNLLQLGVVIIAVVAVVIIAWELWFRKPRKS